MKFELLIFGITAFLVVNTYYDGKYMKILVSWKKYYEMAMYAFLGLSMYLFIKKYPSQSKTAFIHANDMVKYMPIDNEAKELFSPLIDMTTNNIFTKMVPEENTPQFKRMMNSGKGATKRSVSETKKKYVASSQGWKCSTCGVQLPASFEVDHKIRLEHGGSNEVSNLHAQCRNCHGEKTTMENL
tara:strand:- start:5408 stop:5962 length:555 start_codon:yes stop_codon:yes gene_type:complete